MLWILGFVLILLALGAGEPGLRASAAQLLSEPIVLRSQSGQFVVRGLPMGPSLVPNNATSQVSFIRVDPTLLTVSCERIKQALLAELEMRDQWVGSIAIALHPMESFDEPIDVITLHYKNGWNYRIEMPDQVDRARAIKAIVQVLLQEIANRNTRQRTAELPPWLVEGLAANLQATAPASLTLEPETWINKSREHKADPVQKIRQLLHARAPLTFNDLSWPSEEQMAGENAEIYQACAQLFVLELQRLKNGRPCLGRMLNLLSEYMNWQTAFIKAFAPHFQRLLDVEKWWTLNVVHLTSRDLSVTWTRDEALKQLEEVLKVPAHVRLSPKELPMSVDLKLQQILAEWPLARHNVVVVQKIRSLQNLRLRVPQELVDLVDKYRAALESYFKGRQGSGEGPLVRHPLSKDRMLIHDVVKKLDELDAQREALRPATNQAPAQLSIAP